MNTAYSRLVTAEHSRGRVYVEPGWLPGGSDCPELAGLREEHERLLGVAAEKLTALTKLVRAAEQTTQRHAEATREAILAGDETPAALEATGPSADDLAQARREYEAATEALEIWVGRTLARIEEAAPEIEASLAQKLRAAEGKRAEAMQLLAEAERLSAEPKRLRSWLARYVTVTDGFSGEQRKASALGPIAFDALDLPTKQPVPALIREIAGLSPAQVVEVGSDDLDASEKEAILHA